MAPREELDSTPATEPADPATAAGEGFWSRVAALPALQTAKKLVVGRGETGGGAGLLVGAVTQASTQLSAAMSAVTHKFPEQADKFDKLACKCLDVLEDKCPAVQKPVDEVIDDVKTKSNSLVKDSTRYVLKSSVGKPMFRMLNMVIDLSEAAVHALTPPQTPEAADTEESETGESKEKPSPKVTIVLAKKYFNLALTMPLNLWITCLKKTRNFILQLAGKKCPIDNMTPEKKALIEKRRKVSPKKRIRRTFTQQLMALIFSPVTKYCSSGMPFAFVLPDSMSSSPNKHGASEKRKHDDVSDDEEEEGLYDLDNYDSEDDPDYEPSEHGSTDSLEYQEGDTESDIETEPAPPTTQKDNLQQIKEKEGDKQIIPGKLDEEDEGICDPDGESKEKPDLAGGDSTVTGDKLTEHPLLPGVV